MIKSRLIWLVFKFHFEFLYTLNATHIFKKIYMVFVIRKQEISTDIRNADRDSVSRAWTKKLALDLFRDGFPICRGPLRSGM